MGPSGTEFKLKNKTRIRETANRARVHDLHSGGSDLPSPLCALPAPSSKLGAPNLMSIDKWGPNKTKLKPQNKNCLTAILLKDQLDIMCLFFIHA